ncbi:hypothetical protein Ciccas_005449 [Cichlidogyrus casuarinus]|uniref:Uncharacterized protein n=1 Tax=Cichlidogyrus casuarinus TaxID=1844966 RepID=A0ABD2Q8N6_9PLAT
MSDSDVDAEARSAEGATSNVPDKERKSKGRSSLFGTKKQAKAKRDESLEISDEDVQKKKRGLKLFHKHAKTESHKSLDHDDKNGVLKAKDQTPDDDLEMSPKNRSSHIMLSDSGTEEDSPKCSVSPLQTGIMKFGRKITDSSLKREQGASLSSSLSKGSLDNLDDPEYPVLTKIGRGNRINNESGAGQSGDELDNRKPNQKEASPSVKQEIGVNGPEKRGMIKLIGIGVSEQDRSKVVSSQESRAGGEEEKTKEELYVKNPSKVRHGMVKLPGMHPSPMTAMGRIAREQSLDREKSKSEDEDGSANKPVDGAQKERGMGFVRAGSRKGSREMSPKAFHKLNCFGGGRQPHNDNADYVAQEVKSGTYLQPI